MKKKKSVNYKREQKKSARTQDKVIGKKREIKRCGENKREASIYTQNECQKEKNRMAETIFKELIQEFSRTEKKPKTTTSLHIKKPPVQESNLFPPPSTHAYPLYEICPESFQYVL